LASEEVVTMARTALAREEVLDRDECLRLLATRRLGRVAVGVEGWSPLIRPVNYRFDPSSQSVVFRSGQGTKLTGLVRAHAVTFEVDEIDEAARTGWSVIVSGRAEEVVRPGDLAHVEALGLDPWVPGDLPHWFRVRTEMVSGRRIARAGE
jgi:nitroimidazol reductase NimA-like FMN-containing flavoprotein (pyridoxamine 5'-phosphate oxidase superfamily)